MNMEPIDVVKHLAVYVSLEEYQYLINSDNIEADILDMLRAIPTVYHKNPKFIALDWAYSKVRGLNKIIVCGK